MQWDPDVFEQEVRASGFLHKQLFVFSSRQVRKPGTHLEAYDFRLVNSAANRAIDITFALPRADGRPAVSGVCLFNTSTGQYFQIEDYVKQYNSVDLGYEPFRYTSYSGTFRERVRAFLSFATGLLQKYAEPVLQGRDWPHVKFDWKGVK